MISCVRKWASQSVCSAAPSVARSQVQVGGREPRTEAAGGGVQAVSQTAELLLLGHDVAEATVAKYMGIQVPTAPRSPWPNSYCERIIVLDTSGMTVQQIVNASVLNEAPLSIAPHPHELLRLLPQLEKAHLSLDRNSPTPRAVEAPSKGDVFAIPQVGGLHHRYSRAA